MQLKRIFIFTGVVWVLCLGFAWHRARAATFQYIFNNVEQGNNATASPSIRVDGNQVTKQSSPEATPTTTNIVEAANANASVDLGSPSRWRLVLAASQSTGLAPKEAGSEIKDKMGWKPMASLSYFPLRNLGITIFGGQFSAHRSNLSRQSNISKDAFFLGSELEWTVLRMELFGADNLIEVAAIGGGNNMGRYLGEKVAAHAGARLSLNLSQRFGLSAAARTNLSDRTTYHLTQADAGLNLRF